MHLIVVHHHYRPGGVRRVIEVGLPQVLRAMGAGVHRVTLAGGEVPVEAWLEQVRRRIGPSAVGVFHEPLLGYVAEWLPRWRRRGGARMGERLAELLGSTPSGETVVWAHNLGLARNPYLTEALPRLCAALRIRVVAHHHDWWFDQRWARWREMRGCGVRTLAKAARILFESGGWARHAAINQADARQLSRLGRGQSLWLPNMIRRGATPTEREVGEARAWMSERLGDDRPVWLLPCRFLRRKNVAEALLLTRWLRPEAWLVTTGGPSSAEEQPNFHRLREAALAMGWRVRLGLLAESGEAGPSVAALQSASEALLLTSVQEGFGLPYLEAAVAGRPLICRELPNVAPDLRRFGFRFPQEYREVRIDPGLFDVAAERERQHALFGKWRSELPARWRTRVGLPAFLAAFRDGGRKPVPMSRLTLTAQLEVLAQPIERSWAAAGRANPWLLDWRQRVVQNELRPTAWPSTADQWLGENAYENRFRRLLYGRQTPIYQQIEDGSLVVLERFIESKLSSEHMYPLLWSPAS